MTLNEGDEGVQLSRSFAATSSVCINHSPDTDSVNK
jgi:hypothetical protein